MRIQVFDETAYMYECELLATALVTNNGKRLYAKPIYDAVSADGKVYSLDEIVKDPDLKEFIMDNIIFDPDEGIELAAKWVVELNSIEDLQNICGEDYFRFSGEYLFVSSYNEEETVTHEVASPEVVFGNQMTEFHLDPLQLYYHRDNISSLIEKYPSCFKWADEWLSDNDYEDDEEEYEDDGE